jgi:uncharacterized protein YyaL (SSP411 family)
MGMMELVPKIKKLWDEKKEDILNSTEKILNALKNEQRSYGGEELTEKVLEESYNLFEQRFDKQNGGLEMHQNFLPLTILCFYSDITFAREANTPAIWLRKV